MTAGTGLGSPHDTRTPEHCQTKRRNRSEKSRDTRTPGPRDIGATAGQDSAVGASLRGVGAFTGVGNSSSPQRKDFNHTFEFIAQAYLEFSSNVARAESEPGGRRTPQVPWV